MYNMLKWLSNSKESDILSLRIGTFDTHEIFLHIYVSETIQDHDIIHKIYLHDPNLTTKV